VTYLEGERFSCHGRAYWLSRDRDLSSVRWRGRRKIRGRRRRRRGSKINRRR
jgi:hypothetical protein